MIDCLVYSYWITISIINLKFLFKQFLRDISLIITLNIFGLSLASLILTLIISQLILYLSLLFFPRVPTKILSHALFVVEISLLIESKSTSKLAKKPRRVKPSTTKRQLRQRRNCKLQKNLSPKRKRIKRQTGSNSMKTSKTFLNITERFNKQNQWEVILNSLVLLPKCNPPTRIQSHALFAEESLPHVRSHTSYDIFNLNI